MYIFRRVQIGIHRAAQVHPAANRDGQQIRKTAEPEIMCLQLYGQLFPCRSESTAESHQLIAQTHISDKRQSVPRSHGSGKRKNQAGSEVIEKQEGIFNDQSTKRQFRQPSESATSSSPLGNRSSSGKTNDCPSYSASISRPLTVIEFTRSALSEAGNTKPARYSLEGRLLPILYAQDRYQRKQSGITDMKFFKRHAYFVCQIRNKPFKILRSPHENAPTNGKAQGQHPRGEKNDPFQDTTTDGIGHSMTIAGEGRACPYGPFLQETGKMRM